MRQQEGGPRVMHATYVMLLAVKVGCTLGGGDAGSGRPKGGAGGGDGAPISEL